MRMMVAGEMRGTVRLVKRRGLWSRRRMLLRRSDLAREMSMEVGRCD
jgi:hypothetical protein